MTQPAHIANPDELEVAEGREREQLEGWIPSLASDEPRFTPRLRRRSTTAATLPLP